MITKNINNTKEYLTKEEFNSAILDLKNTITDSFDRVFHVMDENTNELRKELRTDFKKGINDLSVELKGNMDELRSDFKNLKRDMNQRFEVMDMRFLSIDKKLITVDNRLTRIEDKNMNLKL